MPEEKTTPFVVNDEPIAPKVLLVDDDEMVRFTLGLVLEQSGFEVVSAANVNDALRLIAFQPFDVLVSDLHMPRPGDGLTVVSAMRHSNPNAVTVIFSAYPAMQDAADAILLQADDILVKPSSAAKLIEAIRARLKRKGIPPQPVESIAAILEEEAHSTIKHWLELVDLEPEIITVALDSDARSAHLPRLFRDLIHRLRFPQPLGTRALVSPAAAEHGLLRRRQGYTAAMMVEESRMLQVSIFQTLQNNLFRVNFSLILISIMAIADEVDSQLAQAMASYISESIQDSLPVKA
jgi:DNA-binding response OmpR family regulator